MFPIQFSYNDLRSSEGYCKNGFVEFQGTISKVLGFIPRTPDEKIDLVWCPLTQLVFSLASVRINGIRSFPLFSGINLGEVGPEMQGLIDGAHNRYFNAVIRLTVIARLRGLHIKDVVARDLDLYVTECLLDNFQLELAKFRCSDATIQGSDLNRWTLEKSHGSFWGTIRLSGLIVRDSSVEICPAPSVKEGPSIRSIDIFRSRVALSSYHPHFQADIDTLHARKSSLELRARAHIVQGFFSECKLLMGYMNDCHFEKCNFVDTVLDNTGAVTFTRCQFHGTTTLPRGAAVYQNCHLTPAQLEYLQAAEVKVVDPIVQLGGREGVGPLLLAT
jgi:hypothetical protein